MRRKSGVISLQVVVHDVAQRDDQIPALGSNGSRIVPFEIVCDPIVNVKIRKKRAWMRFSVEQKAKQEKLKGRRSPDASQ